MVCGEAGRAALGGGSRLPFRPQAASPTVVRTTAARASPRHGSMGLFTFTPIRPVGPRHGIPPENHNRSPDEYERDPVILHNYLG